LKLKMSGKTPGHIRLTGGEGLRLC
jgi:hypothetical protein